MTGEKRAIESTDESKKVVFLCPFRNGLSPDVCRGKDWKCIFWSGEDCRLRMWAGVAASPSYFLKEEK